MSSTLTKQQAITNAKLFLSIYTKNDFLVSEVEGDFNLYFRLGGNDIDYAYNTIMGFYTKLAVDKAAIESGYIPGPGEHENPSLYVNRLPAELFVNTFSASLDAQARADLIKQIESGALSNSDLAVGLSIALATDSTPSASHVTSSLAGFTGDLVAPEINLNFPGVSDDQLNFLIGVYVGSFQRAPEHGGLSYWANDLKNLLSAGLSEHEAFKSIVTTMFQAGAENGEKGTTLSTSAFVTYIYENVLGREPDAGGHAYWVNDLNSGIVERSEFLATFLTAANEHTSDAAYISVRTMVAKFAAQEHVSGASAPGNNPVFLQSVLNGVVDAASAQAKINQLVSDYGTAPTQQFKMMLASWADESPADQMFIDTPEDEAITLVGIASAGAGDTVDFF